jgi:hypothetical protein
MNNHQNAIFRQLLNPALALLGQGLKKSPIGQKLDFANHPYLCKGLCLIVQTTSNAKPCPSRAKAGFKKSPSG